MGSDFSSHAVPRRLWDLHLAARKVKRLGVSVGGELAVRGAAVHGTDRVCLYWLASLYRALAHARPVEVRQRGRRYAESVVPGVFCDRSAGFFVSSRRGNLEFPVQVGAGGHRQGAGGGGAVWRAGGSGVQHRRNPDYYQFPVRLASVLGLPSKQMRQPKIIVVGGGLAGLMATIRVAEAGIPVDLFSIVPVKRSHSVCAQGGINAAKNQKGEGDTVDKHFDETIYGGDFQANQPPVKRMCEARPGSIDRLHGMGRTVNRTPGGLLDDGRFGGAL